MKKIIAILCAAALLACLCTACLRVKPDPPPPDPKGAGESAVLLTLYTDTQPLRVMT
jgi:hypothetical protein